MTGSFARLAWPWQVAWVVCVSLLIALLSVPFGERLFGRAVWWGLAWGWAGCLIPGCLIIVLVAAWPPRWSSLGLAGVAMALRVVTAGWALHHMEYRLRLERGNSLSWLTLFYLFMLAAETVLIVHREDRDNYQQRKKRNGTGLTAATKAGSDRRDRASPVSSP